MTTASSAEGANVILTGRNPERLKQAAVEVGARHTAAFDANDPDSLQSFFRDLSTPIDHVMVTAGAPHYGSPLEMPPEEARRGLTEHLLLALEVARAAVNKVRPPSRARRTTSTAATSSFRGERSILTVTEQGKTSADACSSKQSDSGMTKRGIKGWPRSIFAHVAGFGAGWHVRQATLYAAGTRSIGRRDFNRGVLGSAASLRRPMSD